MVNAYQILWESRGAHILAWNKRAWAELAWSIVYKRSPSFKYRYQIFQIINSIPTWDQMATDFGEIKEQEIISKKIINPHQKHKFEQQDLLEYFDRE